jgi:hypothetical protein
MQKGENDAGKKNFGLVVAMLGFLFVAAPQAQATPVTLFSETFSGFDGSGFAPSPATGQLDSNVWRVTGMSDGNGTFGGTHDSGDFARGSSTGGVVLIFRFISIYFLFISYMI